MTCGEVEDTGGLSPAKDDNEAAPLYPPNFADSRLRRLYRAENRFIPLPYFKTEAARKNTMEDDV